jgi:hypothetical protein
MAIPGLSHLNIFKALNLSSLFCKGDLIFTLDVRMTFQIPHDLIILDDIKALFFSALTQAADYNTIMSVTLINYNGNHFRIGSYSHIFNVFHFGGFVNYFDLKLMIDLPYVLFVPKQTIVSIHFKPRAFPGHWLGVSFARREKERIFEAALEVEVMLLYPWHVIVGVRAIVDTRMHTRLDPSGLFQWNAYFTTLEIVDRVVAQSKVYLTLTIYLF